jgi:transposase
MPPIRNKNQKNSAEQEGRILLAISDLKNGKIHSVRQAAEIYNVSRSTLQNRVNGMAYRAEKRANNHKLTQFEEESLVKWVLDLDKRGLPPRHSLVREMANHLLLQHGNQQVGEKWVYNLVQRRPEIKQGITREEAQALIQGQIEASQAAITTPAEPELPASQPVVRRQFQCSGCGTIGHRINRCPNHASN